MNDLLGDTVDGRDSDLEAGPSSSSIASGIPAAAGQDTTQFFQEVNDVTSSMTEIRKRFLKLQNSNEDYRTVTRATAMKVIKEKMDKDLDEISVIARELKGKLEALDRSNAANRKIRNCHAGSSTDRARMSITSNLKKKLRELTVEFQVLRQRFHDEYREVVQRYIFTATGQKVDEPVIERLIETGDSEQIFQNAIGAQGQGQGEVLDTIAEIQERHGAVKDIEKKLLELHQIFLDMGIVVEAQDELLDNVQAEVGKAVEHVAAGTAQPQKARSLRRGTRKWLCISIILLILAAIILVVTVIQPWKSVTKRPY